MNLIPGFNFFFFLVLSTLITELNYILYNHVLSFDKLNCFRFFNYL